ncbi:acyltransferase [Acinetobacter radioresistens]|uniref:acyltransferase family protein n=1 Tax=Acinetobacter radioresistens TaxID=40216 RepID=UPI002247E209|nr:acyltransferase family protein [Acinetobacter radioresistens]MCX0343644.1 acyltransferase [Acinetobacter radioresistens]
MEFRADIQILRGLAVAFVVFFHLETAGLSSGFLGVDVFFVVSGFLMAILYKTGQTKPFFERRAKRLIPAYFATVVLTLLASLFIVLPSELEQVVTQSIYSLFFANNIGFWMQNSYFSKSDFNPLLHLWSLGVEIQFYLIVPLLAWIFRKSKALLPLAILFSFAACIFIVGISPKTSFFMMPLRMWEFLIGFATACYFTLNGGVKYKNLNIIGLIGLIILIAIPFMNVDGQSLNRMLGHPSLYALGVCLATASIIAFGLPNIIVSSFIGRLFAKVGDYSYSIYLVHFPIIVLYLYQPFSGTRLYPERYSDKVILLILIALAAFFMHRFIEARRINNIMKVYGASLISIIVLIGATNVLPSFMYNEREQNIFSGLKDRAQYRCGKLMRITNPRDISCKLNEQNFNKSVLLVGNSHADSIKQSFQKVANEQGFNTYFLVSNTPLMDSSVTPSQLIDEAVNRKIDHIILHYSPGSLKIEKLDELLKLAKDKNIKVDLILPIPVYDESIPKVLYLNTAKPYDADKYLSQNSAYSKEINKLKSKYSLFKTNETYQYLCDPICQISSTDGKPYYFDKDHLTLTGARNLEPVFREILSI